jgi:DeoR/GlpR family transcriptional regulator of sugar metabolism
MLSTINRLHDNANRIISGLLFEANINNLITNKKINARQQLILSQLNTNPQLGIKNVLSIQNWYKALYRKLTPRTMMRDISNLEELGLLSRTPGGDIRIKYAAQEIELSTYDITSIEYKFPE